MITPRMHMPGWWIWLVITAFIALSLLVERNFIQPAIVVSIGNVLWQWWRNDYRLAFAVEVRATYTLLLLLGTLPLQQWVHWVQLLGTSALLVFDYCPLARMLSLAPWHRREAFTQQLFLRTFFSKPVAGSFVAKERWHT